MVYSTATKGYSLVEVLVAISVLLIALIGPITIAAKGLQSAYYAREQTTALYLAQEGVELMVAIKNDSLIAAVNDGELDEGWAWVTDTNSLDQCFTATGCNLEAHGSQNLSNRNIQPCSDLSRCRLSYVDTATSAPYRLSAASGIPSPYARVITLAVVDGGQGVLITSTVSWGSGLFGDLTRPVTLSTIVSNIYGTVTVPVTGTPPSTPSVPP